MFSLLCSGSTRINNSSIGSIKEFGGPIVYLFVTGFVLFWILVRVDSGTILPRRLSNLRRRTTQSSSPEDVSDDPVKNDVIAEAIAVSHSADPLRVMSVTKAF